MLVSIKLQRVCGREGWRSGAAPGGEEGGEDKGRSGGRKEEGRGGAVGGGMRREGREREEGLQILINLILSWVGEVGIAFGNVSTVRGSGLRSARSDWTRYSCLSIFCGLRRPHAVRGWF